MVSVNPDIASKTGIQLKGMAEIGRRILDAARVATAVHLAHRARRAATGGAAEELPRVTRGG